MEADHNPDAIKYLEMALDELEGIDYDEPYAVELQFALHHIFMALVLLDVNDNGVYTFVQDCCYQIANGAVKREPGHLRRYIIEGINWLKYEHPSGPQVTRPKSGWEKALDGEIILLGDPD